MRRLMIPALILLTSLWGSSLWAQINQAPIPPKKEKQAEPENIFIPGFILDIDPKDKVRNNPSKVHTLKFAKGKTYQIDLNSEWDNYLVLEDANGKLLAADDDGGGYPNARIVYKASESANFKIYATSLSGQTGMYTLNVKDVTGAVGNPGNPAIPQPPVIVVNPFQQQPVKQEKPPEPKKVHELKKALEIDDELTNNDPKDPIRQGPAKITAVKFEKGKTYRIDMISPGNTMDPYLRLVDSNGKQLAADDDGGGYPNALIRIVAPETGTFHIYSTAFGARRGKYSLSVKEDTEEKNGQGEVKKGEVQILPAPVPPRRIIRPGIQIQPVPQPAPLAPPFEEKK